MVIGQGGEAVVYRLTPDVVLKVYMEPTNPVYDGNVVAQQGARLRLSEQQTKLPAFPKGLPPRVIAPTGLAYSQRAGGQIVGYTMPFLDAAEPLLSYGDRQYREQHGIDANRVVTIFRDLHGLVVKVHTAKVVIGDFNDLNVLVGADQAYLVDADSMQFGRFPCRTFTVRFVDPLLCEPDHLVLSRPHNEASDWYAFATMLFQCLLYINPYYGGVHKPKNGKSLRGDARVLHRLTVFSPDVIYPKAAQPLGVLPDGLLGFLEQTYENDKRGDFPIALLEDFRWTSCTACGLWHARNTCPACAAPGVVMQTITVRGQVKATRLFQTRGHILYATHQSGQTKYVYHEDGTYRREDGSVILKGDLDGELRIRLWSDRTVLAKGKSLVVIDGQNSAVRYETETVGRLPVFDANADHLYWIDHGRLVRDDQLSPFTIGQTLTNQTLVWVGKHFGFGFYRAGSLTRGFVFDAQRSGINDAVPIPPMHGNLIDAMCAFADRQVWFTLSVQEAGVIRHLCYVISDKAELLAQASAEQDDGSWLGDSIRGHLAQGSMLYAATDSGIVRVGISGSTVSVEETFPDTEPFVSTDTQLLPGKGIGCCADIRILK
jgi:H/ACA ribonucleoprotein complex subunit 3